MTVPSPLGAEPSKRRSHNQSRGDQQVRCESAKLRTDHLSIAIMSSLTMLPTVQFSKLLRELGAALEEHFGGWEAESEDGRQGLLRTAADIVKVAEVSSFFPPGWSFY